MAGDMFLEIVTKKGGKIKGESLSSACTDQIDVTKFELGVSSPTDHDSGMATGRIHLEFAQFSFPTSIATTPLFQTICTNDQIKTATLTCRKAGASNKEATFLQWRFKDARLVTFKMTGEGEKTEDSITISYAAVEISYKRQKEDGSLAASQSASYNSSSNTMEKPTLGA